MSRLNLVIADRDERYTGSLARYIRSIQTGRFAVDVFTQEKPFNEYLQVRDTKPDILLISPEFINSNLKEDSKCAVIILSDGKTSFANDNFTHINKYQTGERIVNEIIDLYTDLMPHSGQVPDNSRSAVIATVFSAQGGSGKTTLSAGIASLMAGTGLRVFYLNLETFNSSGLFLNVPDSPCGLSDLFYSIKEKKYNLPAKLDILKIFDSRLKIHYFKPADCGIEIDELTENDISILLDEIKKTGMSEIIVVDTESSMSRKNLAILNKSDVVLVVAAQNEAAGVKLNALTVELGKIGRDIYASLLEKSDLIINKCYSESDAAVITMSGKSAFCCVPVVEDLYIEHGSTKLLNTSGSIYSYLKPISGKICGKLNKLT